MGNTALGLVDRGHVIDRELFNATRNRAADFASIAEGKQQQNLGSDDGRVAASVAQAYALVALAQAVQNLAEASVRS